MEERVTQLEQKVEALEKENQLLKSSATIPLAIDQSFRERFKSTIIKTQSDKGANSEDVTVVSSVDFVGQTAGTTVVLNDPTEFLKVVIDGTTYYLAAWT